MNEKCKHELSPELCGECKDLSTLTVPPQVKFGLAIMEMEDGTIRRLPINPKNLPVTMGMVQRMLSAELCDLQAELIAAKLKGMK